MTAGASTAKLAQVAKASATRPWSLKNVLYVKAMDLSIFHADPIVTAPTSPALAAVYAQVVTAAAASPTRTSHATNARERLLSTFLRILSMIPFTATFVSTARSARLAKTQA